MTFEVIKILDNGDLSCKSHLGIINIDIKVDIDNGDKPEDLKVGDIFEADLIPLIMQYIPVYIAKHGTINKIKD